MAETEKRTGDATLTHSRDPSLSHSQRDTHVYRIFFSPRFLSLSVCPALPVCLCVCVCWRNRRVTQLHRMHHLRSLIH